MVKIICGAGDWQGFLRDACRFFLRKRTGPWVAEGAGLALPAGPEPAVGWLLASAFSDLGFELGRVNRVLE